MRRNGVFIDSCMAAEKLELRAFLGSWALSRTIRDSHGPDGALRGSAVLAPAAGGLVYHEAGTLSLGGHALAATRRYLWRAGPEVTICFEDGRVFHTLSLQKTVQPVRHDCPPDVYEGHYDLTDWPRWSCTWQVRGPRKSLRIVSHYAPMG
ncbi:MAG: DUF6314 family protein [Pseudomonadota bacterium]